MKIRSSLKLLFVVLMLLASLTGACWAANIFINGDLEDDRPIGNDYHVQSRGNIALYEEDGNRCLRLTATQYGNDAYLNIVFLVGGATGVDGQNPGHIVLEPGKTYEWFFDVKPVENPEMLPYTLRYYAWPEPLDDGYYKGRVMKTVDVKNDSVEVPGKPGWLRYTGEIIFPEGYHYFSLRIGFYGPQTEFPELPISCLFDNFYLTEKKEIPSTPTGFGAIRYNGSSAVILSWDEDEAGNAEEYLIFRDGGAEPIAVVDAAETTWTDNTTEADKSYSYIIAARNYKGQSAQTEPASVERMGYITGIVKGMTDQGEVVVSGAIISSNTGIADITSGPDGSFSLGPLVAEEYEITIIAPGFEKSIIDDIQLMAGEVYDLGEIVLPSDDDHPNPPALTAADADRHVGIVVLEWVPPTEDSDDVAEYNIYRSLSETIDRSQPPVATVDAGTLIYYDAFEPGDYGRRYYYQIESVDAALNKSKEASNVLSAVVVAPPVPVLSEPEVGVLVTEADYPFELSWETVENEDLTGYSVQLSTSPDFPQDSRTQLLSAGTSDNSVSIVQLLGQGTWHWRVRALYQFGVKSQWSETRYFVALGQDNTMVAPYLNANPQILREGEVKISYYLTTDAKVALRIFNLKGQFVKTLDSGNKAPGLHEHMWNGDNAKGEELRNGLYLVQLKIEAPGKSKTTITKKVLINR